MGESGSIVMSTTDPKPVGQNEKKQAISDPNTKTTQSLISPSTKQEEEEADSKRGRQATQTSAARKTSLLKKCSKFITRLKGQKTKEKSADDGQQGSGTDLQKLNYLIASDISQIREAAGDLEEHYRNIITQQLEKVENVPAEIKNKKKLSEDEKKSKLMDLSNDLTKWKLTFPQKNKDGAEKKDPLVNFKFKSDSNDWWESRELMPQLHMKPAFGESMELKDFVWRYNELKDHHLKLCLLCFSIFPKDAIIKKRLMVQWWVVEGYALNEAVAGDYFNELLEKGFIEAVNDNRSLSVGSCRIHPFNRSALVALAERAKLFNFGGRGEPTQNFSGCFQACLMGEGLISYKDFMNKYTKESSSEKVVEVREKVIGDLIGELEKLHLVINVEEHILEFIDEWFGRMKNLNYLYLGRWKASGSHHIEVEDANFLKKLENMKYLKFLSLQGVSNIISLPDSILEVTKLNVLDLRACYNLESIPQKIGAMLKMLTHLDMSECYLLSHMPKTLKELIKLKVLKGFFVSEDPNINKDCTLEDLRELKSLEKLCIYTKWKEFPQEKNVGDLGNLSNLSKLTITWGVRHMHAEEKQKTTEKSDDSKTTCDDGVNPNADEDEDSGSGKEKCNKLPRNLTKLDLKCFPMTRTPNWLKMENLEHTELKKLYIRGGKFSDLGQYDEGEKCWKHVEVLRLKYLAGIDMEWRRLHQLFPQIKYLEKVSCPRLSLFPCDAKGVWMKPSNS